jgi:type IV secretory pathway VirD2 relaxase
MLSDREREFRLRPRKPPATKRSNEIGAWSVLYKAVMRHARMTRKAKTRGNVAGGGSRSGRRFNQRCAVRVMYSRNAARGQWGAHGRYVARESAAHGDGDRASGFDDRTESIVIARRLDGWQCAGDERMWKFIVSPELGEQVDLKRLTRELMGRIERELGGGRLEWIAVTHHNTEHPHIHVALRGVDRDGHALRLHRDFIKRGMREIAEDLCTRQLGYRTELDAADAERREASQYRYTSLDRAIGRSSQKGEGDGAGNLLRIRVRAPNDADRKAGARLHDQHILQRLIALQRMGLSEPVEANEWHVRGDFETVLRSMQKIGDRQKTLASHGVLMSDPRLTLEWSDDLNWKVLEGRVLVHGEEENGRDAGRGYLMLEGTDARIHHISYTPELDEARHRGQLRTNSFVRLRRYILGGAPSIETEDMGDAESILRNKRYLRETVRQLVKRGTVPEENGWGGWLGRYQAALRRTLLELEQTEQREARRTRSHDSARAR